MIHKCKCGKADISIDETSTIVCCGIVGLEYVTNVRVIDGKVECLICKTVFYASN